MLWHLEQKHFGEVQTWYLRWCVEGTALEFYEATARREHQTDLPGLLLSYEGMKRSWKSAP